MISQIYLWKRTLRVSDSISVHHQESSTVHTAIHTGYAGCFLASSQHNLCDLYILLCVQWRTPHDGQRNCPKHVEFYSKNKFEKLVHLVGFVITIYHDARSSVCQNFIKRFAFDRYFFSFVKLFTESFLYREIAILLQIQTSSLF